MTGAARRWAWAEIELDAIRANVAELGRLAAPAALWAVVKADGYGHGAVSVASAALAAGAEGLAVALVEEGLQLRQAGIEAPILVLSEQPHEQAADLVAGHLTPTVYTIDYAAALAAAARAAGVAVTAHVKVDTGMQRVGVHDRSAADLLATVAEYAPHLTVGAVFTHLACSDEPASPATTEQLDRFAEALTELDRRGVRPPVVHAANSGAIMAWPGAHFDLVRAGIAMYGIAPSRAVAHLADLRPALALKARVAHVKRVEAGSHVSYGWRHRFDSATTVATLPIGYADGVPRRMGTTADHPGADVLVGGSRRPIVGAVTMDQLMVDVGDAPVAVGDEVVLLGSQGSETITADDWAERLGVIPYEVVCGISKRIPRVVVTP